MATNRSDDFVWITTFTEGNRNTTNDSTMTVDNMNKKYDKAMVRYVHQAQDNQQINRPPLGTATLCLGC